MKYGKRVLCFALVLLLVIAFATPVALAQGVAGVTAPEAAIVGNKALASGMAIGIAGLGAAIGMGIAIGRAVDGISRQPEAEGKIRTNLLLGIVFIETVIIYALIVVILIIFVL